MMNEVLQQLNMWPIELIEFIDSHNRLICVLLVIF